jgi:hypothetical protein
VQGYLSERTVEQLLRDEGLNHYVEAILDVDNSTRSESRSFVLTLLLHERVSDAVEQQLASSLFSALKEKGFTNGHMVTARRFAFDLAPSSNTGPQVN